VSMNPIIKFTTLFGLLAVELAIELPALTSHVAAAAFFLVSVVFVWRAPSTRCGSRCGRRSRPASGKLRKATRGPWWGPALFLWRILPPGGEWPRRTHPAVGYPAGSRGGTPEPRWAGRIASPSPGELTRAAG